MHYRRFACLLLGAWLAGSLFMTMVATRNFARVDSLLANPSFVAAPSIQTLGPAAARSLLRHQASELNRFYFETWEFAQLGIGALLLCALIVSHTSGRANVVLAALMLAAVVVMRFYLTPEVVRLGRIVESMPVVEPSPERTEFWNFHIAYSITEVVKLLLGVVLAARMILRGKRAARPEIVLADTASD